MHTAFIFVVYDPVSHIWIKDSTVTTGTVTGFEIQNGTVKWNDDNGPHVRGYNATQGWGNYNTTPVLNFHLTDFTSQDINMIHVRNYSMGADSFYFNFGDGVVSSNKRNALWHTYNESGIYDVCIYDSTGSSWCQQLTINICSYTGLISVANDTLCMGDSTVLSLSSSTGSIQWQHKDGINWFDELGNGATSANYLINPGETTLYRAKVTNGNCIPAYSNLLTVNVNPTIMNYQLLDSSYTRCSNVSNQISVDIPNCTYQWQIFNSLTWINITNANQMSYTDNSSISNMYRVIVSSGGCFADTSDALIVNVVAAPSVPSVTSGSICGPGNVLLQATSSSQSVYWYDTYQDSIMHIGNTFTPYTSATTNYKVKAVDGTLEPIGYPNTSIGTTGTTGSENKGIRFNCSSPATLEYFYVYPQQTGNAKIILKEAGTQIIIKSINVMMQAGSGPVRVWMMSNLLESKVYDLIAVSTSIPFQINTGGISYPISDPGVPITILGYIDSTLHTTNDYYNFYDLHISTGCKSNQALTTITHYPGLYAANITPVGSLTFCQGDSVYLTAPSSASYDYNWMRNGITVSTSGNTYWAKTAGSYSLIISNANCSDTSTAVNVRVPCIQTFDPQEKLDEEETLFTAEQSKNVVLFDQLSGNLSIEINTRENGNFKIILTDQTGREIVKESLKLTAGKHLKTYNIDFVANGIYIAKIESTQTRTVKKFVKY
ncbi:MAG: T9SS type A sorting domain-containing protein [Bacteroidetes bacterium]|nr:T9SS type A sorting domain-containing protein [Bacteroidota bacterium]